MRERTEMKHAVRTQRRHMLVGYTMAVGILLVIYLVSGGLIRSLAGLSILYDSILVTLIMLFDKDKTIPEQIKWPAWFFFSLFILVVALELVLEGVVYLLKKLIWGKEK